MSDRFERSHRLFFSFPSLPTELSDLLPPPISFLFLFALSSQVLDAEYQFDRHKLTFFFEADRRIDFRELVRDLFAIYKTRIWLQQVSISHRRGLEAEGRHAGGANQIGLKRRVAAQSHAQSRGGHGGGGGGGRDHGGPYGGEGGGHGGHGGGGHSGGGGGGGGFNMASLGLGGFGDDDDGLGSIGTIGPGAVGGGGGGGHGVGAIGGGHSGGGHSGGGHSGGGGMGLGLGSSLGLLGGDAFGVGDLSAPAPASPPAAPARQAVRGPRPVQRAPQRLTKDVDVDDVANVW